MLMGWMRRPDAAALDPSEQLPFSWLVAAGKNPVTGWGLLRKGMGPGSWVEEVMLPVGLRCNDDEKFVCWALQDW
jgi:hypothetical protein